MYIPSFWLSLHLCICAVWLYRLSLLHIQLDSTKVPQSQRSGQFTKKKQKTNKLLPRSGITMQNNGHWNNNTWCQEVVKHTMTGDRNVSRLNLDMGKPVQRCTKNMGAPLMLLYKTEGTVLQFILFSYVKRASCTFKTQIKVMFFNTKIFIVHTAIFNKQYKWKDSGPHDT